MWLAITPDRPENRKVRLRMLLLRDVLEHAEVNPDEADMISANLAIRRAVRYVHTHEQRRAGSMPPRRHLPLSSH